MKPDDESRTLIEVTLERWGGRECEIVEHPGAFAISQRTLAGLLLFRRRRPGS